MIAENVNNKSSNKVMENAIYMKKDYNIIKYNLVAFDCENNPDTGDFICAGVFGNIGISSGKDIFISRYFTNQSDFESYLMEFDDKGTKILGYNVSYDEAFLRDVIDDSKILRNASRLIRIGLNKGEIIDIQNISGIEYSLENWIEFLDMKNKFNVEKVSFDDIELRVMMDAKATYYLAEFIQNYFNNQWKITLKNTIGSCALEIFKCNYLRYNIVRPYDERISTMERESLRGGRCEVFYRGIQNVISYDVRSMYVSIMKHCYIPIPDSARYKDNPKWLENYRKYYDKYLSILDVTVEIPEMFIGLLPYYCKVDGINKVIYPVGIFRGVYTNVELQNAEKYGLKILKVHRMIFYYKKDKMFEQFATDIWSKRLKHNRKCYYNCTKCFYDDVKDCPFSIKNPYYNKALDTMNKKTGNSLFGKFSQHVPEFSFYGREEHLPDEYLELLGDKENYVSYVYDYFGENYIDLHSRKMKDSKFTFCCISSFITAYARIYLLNEAKKCGEHNIVYCDTDSLKIKNNGSYVTSGKDLGDFMAEYCKIEPFYAPKFYGTKTKGVNKNKDTYMSFDSNLWGYKSYKIKKPWRFKSAIRNNKKMALWEIFCKTIDMYDDKRIWFGEKFYNSGINSKPYYINSPIEKAEIRTNN
jgi:hypothetical protein